MNTTKEKFKVRNALFEKEDKTDEELELEMEKKIKGISERVEVESKKLQSKNKREKIEAVQKVIKAALLIFEIKKRRNIMATLAGSSLNNIKDFSLEVLNLADAEFRRVTQAIDSGGTLTMAQMTKYQAEVSQYSLISQIMSAVVKELVDSMKAIANKI